MYTSLLILTTSLLSLVSGKICTNITIPVNISARNGVFNISLPTDPTNVTTFAQLLTAQGGNYTQQILRGYGTVTGVYNISATYCRPSNMSVAMSTSTASGMNMSSMGMNSSSSVTNGTSLSNSTSMSNGTSTSNNTSMSTGTSASNNTSTSNGTTVQFLIHGIGFDKSYWDLPYNNYNYSYTDLAVDTYGYSTLSIDRLGINNSSHADPINTIQAPASLAAIYQITSMLRAGTLPGLNATRASKIIHVGHSFGSALSLALAATYPNASDGLVLTGYSSNASFLPQTVAAWNLKIAALNQPLRFGGLGGVSLASLFAPGGIGGNALNLYNILDLTAGVTLASTSVAQNLSSGYLTWSDLSANQYTFLAPGTGVYYDPAIGPYTELNKQPVTMGELLTLGSGPKVASSFSGPVLVVTGALDAVYCGGNCSATGMGGGNGGNNGTTGGTTTLLDGVKAAFPNARRFQTYVQPGAGHALNVHYNATGAYRVILEFLRGSGL